MQYKGERVELLPDREKLIAFADMLVDLELPIVKSKRAKKIVSDTNDALDNVQADMRDQAESM